MEHTFGDSLGHTILVVDDSDVNIEIAAKILQPFYKVSGCTSGKEALQYMEEQLPDLILLDIHMPEMSGFEVVRQLKQKEKTCQIPVIFLTADVERDTEMRGFEVGAMDFITKPLSKDITLRRVGRVMELSHLQRHLEHEVEKQTEKARQRKEQVERLIDQMINALANAIDAKDAYTNGHSVRVAAYSREIARRLGKSEKEQEDIYYMGLLHDIGKIGIPDEIIKKASGLNADEYTAIKEHPAIGAKILHGITEIPGLDTGVRWHHERYDGKGYPDGLKGEEIPELARIIGIADAYDAMASKRSYRDVLPQNVVREEIRKGKNVQFDPRFADVMLQMIDEDVDYQMCQQEKEKKKS